MPWEVNNAGVHMSFPGGNAMFNVYNAELQLSQVHYGEDMKAAGLQTPSQTHSLCPSNPRITPY